MKILFIHTFYREKGGEDNVVTTEMSYLQDAGFDVELLNFQNPASSVVAVFSFLFLLFNVMSFVKTIRKLSAYQPDVVHLHNWHFAASPSVIMVCHWLKVPVVLSIHNFRLLCPSATVFYKGELFLESLTKQFPWKAIKLGVYRDSKFQTFWLALTIYLHKKLKTWQKVSAFIVFSDFVKNIFLQSSLGIPENKFKIKVNSVPDLYFEKQVKRGDHFVFIGRLSTEKGIDVMLEAFAETNLELYIYGYGPLERKVKGYGERCPNIHFQGALPHDQISDVLKHCSALVFPSIWFEGMPLTLLEAFSTGTPVIVSNIGVMPTMVLDQFNGIHFEAGNKVDLIEKLKYWNELPTAEKEEYCERSRFKYEKRYTTGANLMTLKSIYLDVQSKAEKV